MPASRVCRLDSNFQIQNFLSISLGTISLARDAVQISGSDDLQGKLVQVVSSGVESIES